MLLTRVFFYLCVFVVSIVGDFVVRLLVIR